MTKKNKFKVKKPNTKKISALVGILGYGEVGQAMARFYDSASSQQVKIKDLKRDDGLENVDVLNVCIHWTENFIKIVAREIKKINPKLVIIHSTVAPETTKKLSELFPGISIVHSPVRGIHPHLYEGIKTFVKYIGAENKKSGELAKAHLEKLGIKTKVIFPAVSSESGKLLDTTYYALCIAWHGEAKKLCDKFGADFEDAMRDFNKTYNEGYIKLGKPNVVRPTLNPPEKGIGGSCLIPNVKILKKYFKSNALRLILEYEPKK